MNPGPAPTPGSVSSDAAVHDGDVRGAPEGRGRLLVLAGPSGVGKSTVVAELRRIGAPVWFSVSVTTRGARPGEVDGRDYHFVDDTAFDRMVDDGEMLEWAEIHRGLHRSGTPRGPVDDHLAAGVPVLLELDLAGARQVRERRPDALFVFLEPPTWEVLVGRLTGRGTESPDVVQRRLDTARAELAARAEFDVTLVNRDVRDTARGLVELSVGPFPAAARSAGSPGVETSADPGAGPDPAGRPATVPDETPAESTAGASE